MDRASKFIRTLRLPADTISDEDLAIAAWPDAVGIKIAAHTRPAKMVRTRLVVEVEDAVWQRQLFALTHFILRNLEKAVGSGIVEEVEFRILPRRREAQRAAQSVPAAATDESDGIADPVLRGIYRAARKRALA
jgi:Dna[CI] antecedent, DciA